MAKAEEAELIEDCPTRQLMEIIADKWTLRVIYVLDGGTKRPGEIALRIPGISKKMLTQTLRNFEAWGLVKRRIYQEVPPKVEYSLTPLGKRFTEPLRFLCEWAGQNRSCVQKVASRRRKHSK